MIELGPLRLDVISDGLFELRAESFVKIARNQSALFDTKKFRPRVRVGFNSLLIRGEGRVILIDPGTGEKPRDSQVREYKMEWPRKLMPTLAELNVRPDDIDTVILTHLHWDHAGGGTKVEHGGQIVPAFPKARYLLQKRELDYARDAINDGNDGYLSDDIEPLARAHKFDLIDEDNFTVAPWLSLHWSGGHTPGHQIVKIGDENDSQAVFFGDLVPTAAQLVINSVMSYDVDHGQLMAAKRKFLKEAAEKNVLSIFVHAPRNAVGYVRKVDDNKFEFQSKDK
jgi:glyoxylase-like metal-dependent hydrolase (beta-lactamase superfamily II)